MVENTTHLWGQVIRKLCSLFRWVATSGLKVTLSAFLLLCGSPSWTRLEKLSNLLLFCFFMAFLWGNAVVSFAWFHLKWWGSNQSTTICPPWLWSALFWARVLSVFRFICTDRLGVHRWGIVHFPLDKLHDGLKVKRALLPPKQDITLFFFFFFLFVKSCWNHQQENTMKAYSSKTFGYSADNTVHPVLFL